MIPARYQSSRFVGKPLASLLNKPLIQWVHELARKASSVDSVLVATDDERIAETVRRFGGEPVMTSPDHPSGSDRLAEIVPSLDCDLVVNVQGDEPLLNPKDIDRAVAALEKDTQASMSSLFYRITDSREHLDPNVVKVVIDRDGYALYFSRAPIPFRRDGAKG
ncbi:MAG TPA: 3-deoxy-manno-octulosonate cytidylyltransferase, partial [bacterium]|nr:3-deoxy-manno-octulosonate cytidylyltransferase [bacterium]